VQARMFVAICWPVVAVWPTSVEVRRDRPFAGAIPCTGAI
jgi:hypothetical protein